MSGIEALLKLRNFDWQRSISDSFLALCSTFLLTGLIFLFHLYPQIPDTSLAYLLVILALAGTRGLYSALLASMVAFLSFDFFFVPPVYSLLIAKFEDILTLIVFFVTAIITSRLASALRLRAEQARHREQETRTLYALVCSTNREEDIQVALTTFVQAVVREFFDWGIRDCSLLFANAEGALLSQISSTQNPDQLMFLPEEQKAVAQVIQQASAIELYIDALPASHCISARHTNSTEGELACYVRLVPLKIKQEVVGVLRLLITQTSRKQGTDRSLGTVDKDPTPQTVFFSTFLEQAVAVIERGRLQQANMQVKILQQTDALRAALLSSVSHDLRTPLSTIKASATSLLEEEVDWDEEARQSFATAIEREANRLNSLVENLLDMSRIEAGELHPEKVWYPLDELVRDVLDRMRLQFQGRLVQTDIPECVPPVELDYVLIDQVLTNLLENALHYTPAGSPLDVRIQVQIAQVVVSIADRGPGIPPAEREHIFSNFYRMLDKSHVHKHTRGSGLGLSICRGLVTAHGGTIWVEQRVEGGALFCFTLPLTTMEGMELYDQAERPHPRRG